MDGPFKITSKRVIMLNGNWFSPVKYIFAFDLTSVRILTASKSCQFNHDG